MTIGDIPELMLRIDSGGGPEPPHCGHSRDFSRLGVELPQLDFGLFKDFELTVI